MVKMTQELYLVEYFEQIDDFTCNFNVGIYPTLEEAKNQAELEANAYPGDEVQMIVSLITHFGKLTINSKKHHEGKCTIIDRSWIYTKKSGWQINS